MSEDHTGRCYMMSNPGMVKKDLLLKITMDYESICQHIHYVPLTELSAN
jgi:hypothetical protein